MTDQTDNRVLWESFDYPCNVLLPGMKLGYNLTSGRNWTLTSWLSDDIAASGAFTLSWEATSSESKELVMRRRSELYWTSGRLDNQTFEFMVMLNAPFSEYSYRLSDVYSDEVKYFSFNAVDGNTPMWTLTPDGRIVDGDSSLIFTPFLEFCYGYQSNDGCVADSDLPVCRSQNDKFEMKIGDFEPAQIAITYDDNSSLSLSDCMERCWNSCDCVGFLSNSNGTGCIMWTGKNEFKVDEGGAAVRKYVLVSQDSSNGRKDSGYMSPEYAMEGNFSIKSDVFSFGVLLLEIVSGRRNTSFYDLDRPVNLIGYAWELWKEGNALKLQDPALGDSCVANQLLRTIHVGLLCVQESATDRPTMSEVISMLSHDTMPLPAPKQPAFFTGRKEPESTSKEGESNEISVNFVSITETGKQDRIDVLVSFYWKRIVDARPIFLTAYRLKENA
ncbi:hypothetical protein RJ640_001854 [Escallonia rubra]|uniref:Apple domain-containing protein n=1 Tax=Escallonia rubra TaxID=112253 RepID=A0AA88RTH6_9ASTE|nr:hypothetical protein RJ640_001854 [Escallonia rubra]